MAWKHPYTIAVRVEVLDTDSGYPVSGAEVCLQGSWTEYEEPDADPRGLDIGRWDDGQPVRGVGRKWSLVAVTDRKGIAVFGLPWHDHFGRVEDVSKVDEILIRHGDYCKETIPFALGQYVQDDESWRSIPEEYCGAHLALLIRDDFRGYGQERTVASLFFEMVRDERYGYAYPEGDLYPRFPRDYIVSTPQKEAGPFLVIPLQVEMRKITPSWRHGQRDWKPKEQDNEDTDRIHGSDRNMHPADR